MASRPDSADPARFAALLPPQIALACERTGARKVGMDPVSMAGLAGAFIVLGAMFFTVVVSASDFGFGPTRALGGVAFSLGLVLVILAGAELFTGNTLSVMAWASRRVTTPAVLRSWVIVYFGNFAGALLTVLLVLAAKQWQLNGADVGATAVEIAATKVNYGFGQAVALGILCNVLVTLAVWLSLGARSATGKVLVIIFPITAFVAAGFEHSVANMYFIPLGLLLEDRDAIVAVVNTEASLDALSWGNFFLKNLIPVTIGNIIGGAFLVGAVYWFVYLRPGEAQGTERSS